MTVGAGVEKDWLGKRLAQMDKAQRPHRTPKVLRHLSSAEVAAGTTVIRGTGGTVVLRARLGAR